MMTIRGCLQLILRSALTLGLLLITTKTQVVGSRWFTRGLSLKIELCTQPNYSLIIPGLYLSNARAACNETVLQNLNITHILTVETHRLQPRDNIDNLFIRAYDVPSANLLPFFPMANAFIEEGIKKGNVIVHCHFGVSRSATLVIAYIMQKYRLSYDQAYEFVRSKRKFIKPNAGFVQQLKEYERKDYEVSNLQRFEAFIQVHGRKHRYKLASIAVIIIGVIVPLAVLLA